MPPFLVPRKFVPYLYLNISFSYEHSKICHKNANQGKFVMNAITNIMRSNGALAYNHIGLAERFSPHNLARSILPNPIGLVGQLTGSASPLGLAGGASLASAPEIAAFARAEMPARFATDLAGTIGQMAAQTAQTTSSPQTRELALLAADVYRDTPNPPAGYRVATDADLGKLGLKPQDLTSTQSPFRARVYVKGAGADAQFVVSFRGSTSGADWRANFQQGLGLTSDHYSRALYIGSRLARSSAGANVTITGHSLGGGLASATAIASGRNATTFNAAGLSDATIASARSIRDGAGVTTRDNVNAYYVRGEVLSAIQDGGDRVIGGIFGGLLGSAVVDAPEAYGRRIGIESVRPQGLSWYQDNPVARHGMDWVLSSLGR